MTNYPKNKYAMEAEVIHTVMKKAVELYLEAPAQDGMSVEFCDVVVPAMQSPSQTITVASISTYNYSDLMAYDAADVSKSPKYVQQNAYEYYVGKAREQGSVVRHRELVFEYVPMYKAYFAHCPHCKFTYKFFVADEFLYDYDQSALAHYISSRLLESEDS